MELTPWLLALGGYVAAFLLGSLAEYVVHRLMHKRILLGEIHTDHHAKGYGQGFIPEFKAYFIPALPTIVAALVLGWLVAGLFPLGAGVAVGGLCYCAFAAYAHQVQHDFPELVWWMVRPVHTIHHTHKMWHHNFGIAFDIWDRVFCTYKKVEWTRPRPIEFRRFFQIHWRNVDHSAGSMYADMEPLQRASSGSGP
jgi:sterol desaturase/sphingolipid hydroxylase (fatty acid hydroxylase superfamily)